MSTRNNNRVGESEPPMAPHIAAEMGVSDGYEAAMRGQSRTSYPRLGLMNTEESHSAYVSYFNTRYDQTMAAKKTAGSSDPSKVAEVLSDEVSKLGGLSVSQWEGQSAIPSWEVANAVAANFNADELAFERAMATGEDLKKVQSDPVLYSSVISFVAQWRTTYAAIRSQQGFTPSTAVAEVRRARAAMFVLQQKVATAIAAPATPATPPKPYSPPPKPATPPAPLPIGAKSKLPTWGIVGALAAAGAGVWYFFFKKKEPKKLLPPGAMR